LQRLTARQVTPELLSRIGGTPASGRHLTRPRPRFVMMGHQSGAKMIRGTVSLGFRIIAVCIGAVASVIGCARSAPTPTVDSATGITLILIPAGTFTMGSAADEAQRGADETRHTVTLTRPFFLAAFEVSQSEWRQVIGSNPSHFNDC